MAQAKSVKAAKPTKLERKNSRQFNFTGKNFSCIHTEKRYCPGLEPLTRTTDEFITYSISRRFF